MKLHLVPARQGFSWAIEGWRVFCQQPWGFLGLFILWFVAASLLGALPIIGLAVAQALTPIIGLIMMVAATQVRQGNKFSPALLIKMLGRKPDRLKILALIGLTYFLATTLTLAASTLIDDGLMARIYLGWEALNPEIIRANPEISQAALFMAVIQTLLFMPFWHASALTYWHGLPATKAMFFSFIACLRNMGAFTIYGLTFGVAFFLLTVVAMIFGVILGLMTGPNIIAIPMTLLLLIGSLVIIVNFLVSAVFTFRDCFDPPEK